MMDVVILAGGKGTRLLPLTETRPKPLVQLGGRPIIDYVVDRLPLNEIGTIVLAVGHMAEQFKEYATELSNRVNKKVILSVEPAPLYSAGAVRLAIERLDNLGSTNESLMILNGDIVTDIDLSVLTRDWRVNRAHITFASLFQEDATRFGTIITDEYGNVVSFEEKNPNRYRTYINSGILMANKQVFRLLAPLGVPMSYERELVPAMIEHPDKYTVCAIKYDDCYFNDIADVNALETCEKYLPNISL